MTLKTVRNLAFALMVTTSLFAAQATLRAGYVYDMWNDNFNCEDWNDGPSGWFGLPCYVYCGTGDMWWQNYVDTMTNAACDEYCSDQTNTERYCEMVSSAIYDAGPEECWTSCTCFCQY